MTAALASPLPAQQPPPDPTPVVVASKPFAESALLAEMFAQLLEARGFNADRRLYLGATEIAFGALRTGAIDVYPEYTGTGLVAVLGEPAAADPREVYRTVRREFAARYGVEWLPPLGFENSYAVAVRRETAEALSLRTLSDLAEEAPGLTAGFTADFIGREDGLPGLREAYGGFEFGQVRPLLQALKYQALAEEAVDVIDGYSTDGAIDRYDLVVLEDDLGFFPAYEAAAIVAPGLRAERPEVVAALTELSGLLDEPRVRALNRRLEVDGDPVEQVAAEALRELGLVGAAAAGSRTDARGRASSFPAFLWSRRAEIWQLTLRHLLLVGLSLGAAILVAVPLGLALEGRAPAEGSIRAVGVWQTIPSIALLAFMIPLLGIGILPAVVALFLYALYPILRNTYTGVREVDRSVVDSARSLGMTDRQVMRHVRLPLAAPVIMAGVRTAAVINVGTATLAAFIGAGGLGDPIVAGLALSDTWMILSGAVPAALLAILVDAGLAGAERMVTPEGVSG